MGALRRTEQQIELIINTGEGRSMAEQLEMFSLPNPCRGLCQANARGYCLGCFRNREERFGWQGFSDAKKRNVLRRCTLRQRAAQRVMVIAVENIADQGELF